jgi:hypothetical protein
MGLDDELVERVRTLRAAGCTANVPLGPSSRPASRSPCRSVEVGICK